MRQNNYQGALQVPTGSGFNAKNTALDVMPGVDLSGRVSLQRLIKIIAAFANAH